MTTAVYSISTNYKTRSDIVTKQENSQLLLALDTLRDPVGIRGTLTEPALFREALMTAVNILGSDLRYKRKDRTTYLAYLMKQGKKATAAIWDAQKAFLEESFADEVQENTVLDPVLSVHPDQMSLEVFSKDESTYARLAFDNSLFQNRQAAHGTSFVDLSGNVLEKLERLRTYQPVSLNVGQSIPSTLKEESKSLEIPYAWLRGFLQVQTAATLPVTSCELQPIDFYNILYALRTRKTKKPPRALRFELVPGSSPRMILEPWEIVLESHGPAYRGKQPRVVRTYGRRRLMVLASLLPYMKRVRVMLVGAGLPTFWVFELGNASLTLGLTGWTASGWSTAASFDSLVPSYDAADLADKAHALLQKTGPLPLSEIVNELQHTIPDVREALKLECMRGRLLYDLSQEKYRPRQLLAKAIDENNVRYSSKREAQAHRLLGNEKTESQVQITKIHEISGEGFEISGEIDDKEARRAYITRFTLDLEGRVRGATCACPSFRRSGLKEGPCEHMLALRLAFARKRKEEEAMRQTPEGRKLIRAETRTLVRRNAKGKETVYQISLDNKLVRLVWGERTEEARQQRLWFDTDKQAREAYFSQLEQLTERGFIEAEASVA